MKKQIKIIINSVLLRFGLRIIRVYELSHQKFKYKEAISEITGFFNEFVLKNLNEVEMRGEYISNLYGTQVSEALYLAYYLEKSTNIDGDVCEFGCANGATSAFIANEIKSTDKKLWLFDSFKGLSKPSKKDKLINDMFGLGSISKYKGTMSYSIHEVKERLKKVNLKEDRVKIVSGYINKTIKNKGLPSKVSFSFIDFDLYEPIKIALEFNNSRLSANGYIIVDDYGFFSSGVKSAVDEFLKKYKNKYEIILPRKFAGSFCILRKKK